MIILECGPDSDRISVVHSLYSPITLNFVMLRTVMKAVLQFFFSLAPFCIAGERRVMFDNERGGLSLRVNVRSAQDGRNAVRRTSPHRLTRPDERTTRRDGRSIAQGAARARNRDAREREIRSRDAREEISRRRATNKRPTKSMALQASIERDRIMLQKEKEERNFLRMEREKLEKERRQLERDRIERSRYVFYVMLIKLQDKRFR